MWDAGHIWAKVSLFVMHMQLCIIDHSTQCADEQNFENMLKPIFSCVLFYLALNCFGGYGAVSS